MIPKLPISKKKRLVIIQFLDENECKTGYVLANNIRQSSPFIGNVDYFSSSKKDEIINYISQDIPHIIREDEEVAVYIDTHGFSSCDGIWHKKDFISWDELVLAIKNAVNKLRTLPIIILTACNGISIKNTINQLDEPICSKLYAGDGIMLNGPVMGGFSRLLNESGLEFGEKELETLNEELAKRDNPPFICIDYKP